MSLEALYRKLNKQAEEREKDQEAVRRFLEVVAPNAQGEQKTRAHAHTIKGMKRRKHSTGLLKRRYN